MDAYEQAYQDFRNRRMKPKQRGSFKMNDEVKQEEVNAEEANEASVQEQVGVYEKAAEMYRGGDKEGALNHIKENLGEQAATDAEKVMEEADKINASADEGSEDGESA